jgi:hypothetical protein
MKASHVNSCDFCMCYRKERTPLMSPTFLRTWYQRSLTFEGGVCCASIRGRPAGLKADRSAMKGAYHEIRYQLARASCSLL